MRSPVSRRVAAYPVSSTRQQSDTGGAGLYRVEQAGQMREVPSRYAGNRKCDGKAPIAMRLVWRHAARAGAIKTR